MKSAEYLALAEMPARGLFASPVSGWRLLLKATYLPAAQSDLRGKVDGVGLRGAAG